MIAEARTLPTPTASDLDILAGIEEALWQDSVIRTFDKNSLKVEVRNGIVFLSGHMASLRLKQVEELIRTVQGVAGVRNEIVDDSDLVMAVALALAADPRTEPYLIRVGAFHGWIYLMGQVPADVAQAAEEVAAQVPDVRGILGVPESGEHDPSQLDKSQRRSLQPMPGAEVYAQDLHVGRVSQVVINPRNRLVSCIAVQAEVDVDGQLAQGEFVLPVEDIELVNDGGVFLRDTSANVVNHPVYMEDDFPLPPANWIPPFPYRPGQVRWPHSTH